MLDTESGTTSQSREAVNVQLSVAAESVEPRCAVVSASNRKIDSRRWFMSSIRPCTVSSWRLSSERRSTMSNGVSCSLGLTMSSAALLDDTDCVRLDSNLTVASTVSAEWLAATRELSPASSSSKTSLSAAAMAGAAALVVVVSDTATCGSKPVHVERGVLGAVLSHSSARSSLLAVVLLLTVRVLSLLLGNTVIAGKAVTSMEEALESNLFHAARPPPLLTAVPPLLTGQLSEVDGRRLTSAVASTEWVLRLASACSDISTVRVSLGLKSLSGWPGITDGAREQLSLRNREMSRRTGWSVENSNGLS